MKKRYSSLISALLVAGIIYGIFFAMMPQNIAEEEVPLTEFSTKRALEQVASIAKSPHYVGSENHKTVASLLEKELQKLGLETATQEGYTLTEWGNLAKSKNILARIKGSNNSKALMLLSHYDSAPHSSSLGAADDASGIATILESVRAFLANKTANKNDIIILFSDAEELGLNGAALFVTEHPWAKDVGLVLNLEARGSAGPSYMLMETNKGNAAMVKEFTKANPGFPVSNSLMYSIYKMLPNDTDLTVFREEGKIQGFNFAFIDDHFNYHTQQDDIQHLSPTTLAHQGTYIVPLLNYFSNTNLSTLNDGEDYVYFNTPFYFVSYPFSWNYILVTIAGVLFIFIVFIGIGKRALSIKEIGRGFAPFFASLLVSGAAAFLGWKILNEFYPQYKDILHGFTYNGHYYIGFFVFISLAISFAFYKKYYFENQAMNFAIAPLFLWLLINIALAIYLPGAGFFIIPVFCALIMLAYFVITQKKSWILNLILSIPAFIIFIPFITTFPIGLGLKLLAGSAVLTVLVFTLLLPVFGYYSKKGIWAMAMLLIAIGFFIKAHLESGYESGKAKPNSLLYVYDGDTGKALWVTYDQNLDSWTKGYLGEKPSDAKQLEPYNLFSKYNSKFTYSNSAPAKELEEPTIQFLRDTVIGTQRHLKIKISPNRKVNRYDIFAHENLTFHNLRANGVKHINQKGSAFKRKGRKLLSYYVTDNEPLELQFSIASKAVLDMDLMESSFDLMSNKMFSIAKRENWMMPTPFVLNDAVVIKQKIKPNFRKEIIPEQLLDSLQQQPTTLEINANAAN
ncbi:M28 family peptidase [Flavobacterium lindanitolerans]|uniref:Vacuolar membrane protease n=1 Tax=Flavobacterium lindanitolerans TaxID=428988 RepID=A0A497V9W9_9FLAO|nr:M28 family peptidase [Flavobacterium lindanitolerans]PKW28782.1 peptidase M28-like protein [Flavobacterium lindanitolerans]RLJ35714.1 peptidase M28-like protein [Flavobacterium lindanitolerans]